MAGLVNFIKSIFTPGQKHDGLYQLPQGTVEEYTQQIDKDPINAIAYFNRGILNLRESNLFDAIYDFQKVIDFEQSDITLLYRSLFFMGLAKAEHGDYRSAIQDYTIAIDFNPKLQLVHHQRALAKFKLGDYSGTIADCTREIEIRPTSDVAYCLRGQTQSICGRDALAVDDLSTAIKLNPNLADAYISRGIAKMSFPDKQQSGCEDIAKAVKLGLPGAAETYAHWCGNRGIR